MGTRLDVNEVVRLLAVTPDRLAAMSGTVSAELLWQPPADSEWSANDVLAHLRSCADVWGGCIATTLTEDAPTIRAINPRTWIERTDYLDLEFALSLKAFTTQRRNLLKSLQGLTPHDWNRTAIVTGAGKPLQRTVLFYATWLATHERPHLKQVERAVRSIHSGERAS